MGNVSAAKLQTQALATSPAPRSTERDHNTGRFLPGSRASRLQLLDLPPEQARPELQSHLRRAQTRFRSAKLSGLLKAHGTRLDGLLRGAVLADLAHDVLVELALKAEPAEFRVLMAEAAGHAERGQGAWMKLLKLTGLKRKGEAEQEDPLVRLAREVAENSQGETEESDDE